MPFRRWASAINQSLLTSSSGLLHNDDFCNRRICSTSAARATFAPSNNATTMVLAFDNCAFFDPVVQHDGPHADFTWQFVSCLQMAFSTGFSSSSWGGFGCLRTVKTKEDGNTDAYSTFGSWYALGKSGSSVTCISFFCRRLHWYLLDIVFCRVLGFAAVVQGCEDF